MLVINNRRQVAIGEQQGVVVYAKEESSSGSGVDQKIMSTLQAAGDQKNDDANIIGGPSSVTTTTVGRTGTSDAELGEEQEEEDLLALACEAPPTTVLRRATTEGNTMGTCRPRSRFGAHHPNNKKKMGGGGGVDKIPVPRSRQKSLATTLSREGQKSIVPKPAGPQMTEQAVIAAANDAAAPLSKPIRVEKHGGKAGTPAQQVQNLIARYDKRDENSIGNNKKGVDTMPVPKTRQKSIVTKPSTNGTDQVVLNNKTGCRSVGVDKIPVPRARQKSAVLTTNPPPGPKTTSSVLEPIIEGGRRDPRAALPIRAISADEFYPSGAPISAGQNNNKSEKSVYFAGEKSADDLLLAMTSEPPAPPTTLLRRATMDCGSSTASEPPPGGALTTTLRRATTEGNDAGTCRPRSRFFVQHPNNNGNKNKKGGVDKIPVPRSRQKSLVTTNPVHKPAPTAAPLARLQSIAPGGAKSMEGSGARGSGPATSDKNNNSDYSEGMRSNNGADAVDKAPVAVRTRQKSIATQQKEAFINRRLERRKGRTTTTSTTTAGGSSPAHPPELVAEAEAAPQKTTTTGTGVVVVKRTTRCLAEEKPQRKAFINRGLERRKERSRSRSPKDERKMASTTVFGAGAGQEEMREIGRLPL